MLVISICIFHSGVTLTPQFLHRMHLGPEQHKYKFNYALLFLNELYEHIFFSFLRFS